MKKANYEKIVASRMTKTHEGVSYAGLGLSGESGEVFSDVLELLLAVTRANESVKKFLRNNDTEKYRERIVSELGDVQFYLTKVAQDVGADLAEVMDYNVAKITERNKNGFAKG